jgi:hypothetical protein
VRMLLGIYMGAFGKHELGKDHFSGGCSLVARLITVKSRASFLCYTYLYHLFNRAQMT